MAGSSMALGAYAAVFAPLEAQGRADAVARRLGDSITLGLLPDGSPAARRRATSPTGSGWRR